MSVKQEVSDVEVAAVMVNGGVRNLQTVPAQHQRFHFSNPLCLVNLNLLSEALWCSDCNIPLSLRACLEERAWRDSTFLKIKCHQCCNEKGVLLCNDDPDDEMYHHLDNFVKPETTTTNKEDGVNFVLDDSVRPKRSRAAKINVTKTKRGRPPGSKNKKNLKAPLKSPNQKRKLANVSLESPPVKRIRIRPLIPPCEDFTSALIEATYSDEEENKNENVMNASDAEMPASPMDNDSASSDDEMNLSDSKESKGMQCQYCPLSFARKNLHAQHMKNDHPEVRAFFCEICSEEFTTIYFLRKHKMEFHLPKNSPKCDTCGQAFLTQEMLNAHKLKHMPKEARHFKCNQCSKKFFEAKRLRVHTLRFHQKNVGNFRCAHCPRGYDAKRKLLRHILEHVQDDIYAIKHGNEYARWKCEYCVKIFKNMGRQLVHMRECHPEFKAMICGWCGEQCTTVKSFQKHRRMNHRTDSLYVCDECGKPTLNPKKLALHKLSHRTDNEGKEFLCSYCPRAFAENSALVDHIKRFHIITTYYCEHCPKTFKMKFNIRRHMQLHTGVFRHSCPYCGANFVAADGRDHHIRNCHRFMCVVCSSIFPTKDDVVMHRIRDHPTAGRAREGDPIFEKITDYNCEICFRYLSSKQALNTHLRTHMKRKSKEADYSISE